MTDSTNSTDTQFGMIMAEVCKLSLRMTAIETRLTSLEGHVFQCKLAAQAAADAAMKALEYQRHLPCADDEPDTSPECPIAISERPPSRHSIHDDDESEGDRPSIITERISVGVGPVWYRGSAIIGLAIAAVAATAVALGWLRLP